MNEKRIVVYDNTQQWANECKLKSRGWKKIADCFWLQIFEKDGKRIIVERSQEVQ